MKLKYYMRGLGIGILVTAVIMGIALNGKRELTDAEIKERAKALGMVEESAVLLPNEEHKDAQSTDGTDSNAGSENIDIQEQNAQEDQTAGERTAEDAVRNQAATQIAYTVAQKVKAEQMIREAEDAAGVAGKGAAAQTDAAEENSADDIETGVETSTGTEAPTGTETSTGAESSTGIETSTGTETSTGEAAAKVSQKTTVVVESGNGSDVVSRKLAEAGLVDSAAAFDEYLCNRNYDNKITIGKHTIPSGSTYEEIARILISAAE